MTEPKYDKHGCELLPVYIEDEPEPIGCAADKARAARIVLKYCSEELGDPDPGITAADISYSAARNAWKLDA